MKKKLLLIILLFCAFSTFAQLTPINNGLPDYPPTDFLYSDDAIILGTYGGGIFVTYDKGETWLDYNGDLSNLFVNDLSTLNGLLVATDGGPFGTWDGINYFSCIGTGLTNTDVNFFTWGNDGSTKDYIVGTSGGGFFIGDYTSPWILDWTELNTGLTGAALNVVDGISAVDFSMIATDDGLYRLLSSETTWTAINNGLSGEALQVQKFGGLGSMIFIATHGGMYYSTDIGSNWGPIIANEKFNTMCMQNTDLTESDNIFFALGEKGFYTEDLVNWIQMDFGGIEGEVTAATSDSTNLYLGFTIYKKSGQGNGGIYKIPLDQIILAINEYPSNVSGGILKQNYPNPFSGSTKISYTLSNSGLVSLTVYNVLGKEIQKLVNEFQPTGSYSYDFDAGNHQEKIYFYTLKINNTVIATKKMILTRK